jgi:hypothetical protein
VYEKRVLRGIIRPKQEGIQRGQKHYKLYSSENISRLMHWGHTARTTELGNTKLYRIIIDETEKKGPLKSLG